MYDTLGLQAAKAAGMRCVVTQSVYSKGENFDGADILVDNLDAGMDGPITITYLNCM
jgi:beta-phosphoglucomutase-like phosphatase (HAD superfamily)